VRNCVESETTIDSDYCELSVVAFRRHADMSQEQGDLSRNTAERREEYGLAGAQHATSVVNRFNLIPQGLARETLNSVQFFRLMINQKGNEFFVPGDSRASGFHVQNHVFKVDPATFANDGKLQDQIQENLNALESIVSRFEASGPNTEDQIKAIADFVSLYNQTARSILQVVSPAQFYKLDRQLAELQAVLSESIKQQSTVSNSASLTRRLQDYERISAFLRERSSTQLQYNLTINLRDLPRKAEPVPERVYPSLDSVLGKSFPYGPILPFGNAADGKLTGLSVKVLDSERGDSSYYYDVVIVDLNNVAQTRELQPNSRLGATDYAFVETLRQLKLPEGVYTAESTARAVSLQECRLWITVNVKSEDRRRVACQVSSWSSDEGWMAEATIVSRGADSALNTSVEKPE
jgi:hypothetical protein